MGLAGWWPHHIISWLPKIGTKRPTEWVCVCVWYWSLQFCEGSFWSSVHVEDEKTCVHKDWTWFLRFKFKHPKQKSDLRTLGLGSIDQHFGMINVTGQKWWIGLIEITLKGEHLYEYTVVDNYDRSAQVEFTLISMWQKRSLSISHWTHDRWPILENHQTNYTYSRWIVEIPQLNQTCIDFNGTEKPRWNHVPQT